MIKNIVDYFKNVENFSILVFLGYVIGLTHVVGAFVVSLCFKA